MSLSRTIEICGLNVAMHTPHSQERYVDLFKAAYELKSLIAQGELHGLLLGSLYDTETWTKNKVISGEIYRFVKVDANEPWFNTRTLKQATDQDVKAISIPPHLLAHLQRIPFIFSPSQHRLWFVARDRKNSLGALAAERFIQQLLDLAVAVKDYPIISVTALPDTETLKKLLSMHQLQRLIIEVKRPNPDDAASAVKRAMERLENMNAKKLTEELIAVDGKSIKPDKETRELAVIASENGKVTGIGKTADGLPSRESTAEKPMRIFSKINDAVESAFDILKRQISN